MEEWASSEVIPSLLFHCALFCAFSFNKRLFLLKLEPENSLTNDVSGGENGNRIEKSIILKYCGGGGELLFCL